VASKASRKCQGRWPPTSLSVMLQAHLGNWSWGSHIVYVHGPKWMACPLAGAFDSINNESTVKPPVCHPVLGGNREQRVSCGLCTRFLKADRLCFYATFVEQSVSLIPA
jgi:hypothetical protein